MGGVSSYAAGFATAGAGLELDLGLVLKLGWNRSGSWSWSWAGAVLGLGIPEGAIAEHLSPAGAGCRVPVYNKQMAELC